jgi:hypothetical protein
VDNFRQANRHSETARQGHIWLGSMSPTLNKASPLKCLSYNGGRNVRKPDTRPRNDVSKQVSRHYVFAAKSGAGVAQAWRELLPWGRSQFRRQLIRIQPRFNACISFSASTLSAKEPAEPSRLSSIAGASAVRPTR